jgi:hypothetical protein
LPELVIIPVWGATIIPGYYYPAHYYGLFQVFGPLSRKLLPESSSDSNQLLPDGEFATRLSRTQLALKPILKCIPRFRQLPTFRGMNWQYFEQSGIGKKAQNCLKKGHSAQKIIDSQNIEHGFLTTVCLELWFLLFRY